MGVFQQLVFLGQSYHGVLYISKSSCLWCINHHVNVQKELQRYVIKNFSPRVKVIIVFLRNLSKIIMLFTQKLLGVLSFLFEQMLLYIIHQVHGAYITVLFTQKLSGGMSPTTLFPVKNLSWGMYLSYQLRDA